MVSRPSPKRARTDYRHPLRPLRAMMFSYPGAAT